MRRVAIVVLILVIARAFIGPAGAQAPAEAFKAALASAEAANKKAGDLKNQWTTTSAALSAAKKSAEVGDFAAATQLADQAEALAMASIAQVEREKTLWKESEIR
jgi:hypothetical protein